MVMILSRLSLHGEVRAGRNVQARWICNHPMETGFRVDDSGQKIQRNIITQVEFKLNGEVILLITPGTGWSSPVYVNWEFTVPPQGGTLSVHWQDDHGEKGQVQHRLVLL
jgi:hypothetical protein